MTYAYTVWIMFSLDDDVWFRSVCVLRRGVIEYTPTNQRDKHPHHIKP